MKKLVLALQSLFYPSVDGSLKVFHKQIKKLEKRKEINEQLRTRNHEAMSTLQQQNTVLLREEIHADKSIEALKAII